MFRVYIWTRDDGGYWKRCSAYRTQREAQREAQRLERTLRTATTVEYEEG